MNSGFEFLDLNHEADRVLRIEIKPESARFIAAQKSVLALVNSSGATGDNPLVQEYQKECSKWMNAQLPASVCATDDASGNKVIERHVSSALLMESSPVFRDLCLENPHDLSLELDVRGALAFLELINFLYGKRSTYETSPFALFYLLAAAIFYEVESCVTYCCKLLRNLLSLHSLPFYFCCNYLYMKGRNKEALLLFDDAKKFLLSQHLLLQDKQSSELALHLPLNAVQVLLSSDDLLVESEDQVLLFVLEWARHRYPKLEERRQILSSHVGGLIRFSHVSSERLKEILSYDDFDPHFLRRMVSEALQSRVESGCQISSNSSLGAVAHPRGRLLHPVKVVELGSPTTGSMVSLELKREECAVLSPTRVIISQPFSIAKREYALSLYVDDAKGRLGVSIFVRRKESERVSFRWELAAVMKALQDLVILGADSIVSRSKYDGIQSEHDVEEFREHSLGTNMFGIPWAEFISDDSPYFINGIFRLVVQIVTT
ncbi:hypothetical protein Tsubulata_008804 [Turnera subulata]|uniref:BTB domain-containing protein n=1 Tax=Turnera subulata TaxID=218843 RepID=A0A9Q0JLM0_9ROSI|nr:hypothetical protein Tsubulata_008804 [Turnera subulata]